MSSKLQSWNRTSRLAAWNEMITECRNSGIPVRQWCAENHVAYSTYYKRLKCVCEASRELAEETPAGYYEIPTVATYPSPAIVLRFGSASAEIFPGTPEEIIHAVIKAVATC